MGSLLGHGIELACTGFILDEMASLGEPDPASVGGETHELREDRKSPLCFKSATPEAFFRPHRGWLFFYKKSSKDFEESSVALSSQRDGILKLPVISTTGV